MARTTKGAVNTTTRRFPRSTREAFTYERFPATEGPYRRNTFARQLARVSVWLGAFALMGVLIAWRI